MPSTSPAPGRRCTAPAATSAPAAWSCRPSAPSTSPCGTSRPGCWTCRFSRCSAGPVPTVPIYGSGGFTTLDDAQLGRAGRDLAARRVHRHEDQDRPGLGHRHRRGTCTGCASCGSWPATGVELMVDANGGYIRRRRPAGSAPPSTTSASAGSKNRSAATTSTACASCATRAALRRRRRRVRVRPL